MKITQRRRIAAVALVATGAMVGAVLVSTPASASITAITPGSSFNDESAKRVTLNLSGSIPSERPRAYPPGSTVTLTRTDANGQPVATDTVTGFSDVQTATFSVPADFDMTDSGDYDAVNPYTASQDGPANPGLYDALIEDGVAGEATVGAQTDSCTRCFTVVTRFPLRATSFSPNALAVGGSANVTTAGQGFARGTKIEVLRSDGVTPDPFITTTGIAGSGTGNYTTTTSMLRRWVVGASASEGLRDVRVTNTDGISSICTGCFTVLAAPLTEVNPTAGTNGPDYVAPDGSGLHTLTFRGTDLRMGTPSLQFVGNPGSATANQLTISADTSSAPVFAVDGRSVTAKFDLRNAAPGPSAYQPILTQSNTSTNACACRFTILQPVPASATSLDNSPDAGIQKSQAAGTSSTYDVVGSRLSKGFKLLARTPGSSTTDATITTTGVEFLSDTSARVTLNIASGSPLGNRDIVVQTTDNTTGAACAACLTVTPGSSASPTPTATGTATATPTATATGTPTATATATPTATATGTPTATATATPTATATATSTATPTATATSASPTATPTSGTDTNGRYVALGTPVRVVDSRPAPDNKGTTVGKKLGTVTVDLSNVLGGTNAQSAVLNLTVVDGNASGNAVVHAGGSPVPETSNINYTRGQIQANQVVTLINQSNKTAAVTVRGSATHVIVDMVGYFTAENVTSAGRVVLQTPRRVAGAAFEKNVSNGSVLRVTFGPNDLPAGSTSALLNVTVAGPDAPSGFVVAYPTGTTQPATSNVNFVRGLTQANEAIARIGAGNSVDLKISRGGARLIVDVVGGVVPNAAGQVYSGLVPDRFVDTRPGNENQGANPGRKVGTFNVTLPSGVPAGATGVVLNVTSVDALTGNSGFIVAFPAGTSQPATSNVNWRAGATQANEVIVAIGANRQISLNVGGSKIGNGVHIVVDLVGYLSPTGGSATPTATSSAAGQAAGGEPTTSGQPAASGEPTASGEPPAEGEPTPEEEEPTPTATAEECFPGPDPLCL